MADSPTDGSAPANWSPSLEDAADVIEYYQSRPVAFFEDMGYTLADTQKELLNACLDHDRILILSGNGTGKTAGATMASYWYWATRWNSLVMVTSGNYDILRDSSWPFLQTIHRKAQDAFPVLGETKQSPPRVEVDDWPEWFLKYASPAHPENLQGRHARRAMVVIEEADKPDVSPEHFDSATSTASSKDDVVIAIANPPTEKSNIVYQKMQSDRWKVIQFSSFESHNVLRELGELPDDDPRGHIPGLVDLDLVVEDYETWNGRDWPGADKARAAITTDEDGIRVAREDTELDPRWYRKRLGVMPPTGAGVLRPWYERHVDDAVERYRQTYPSGLSEGWVRRVTCHQLGADIARGGGDRTGVVGRFETSQDADVLKTLVEQETGDHRRNRDLLEDADDRVERDGIFQVDAVGEGSGVADELRARRQRVKRFQAGANADDDGEYYDARTEALVELGNALKDGDLMVPPNTTLERELRYASRVLEMEERALRGDTVLRAKGKDRLKQSEHLGRSPDLLDAAMLAVYDPYDSQYVEPSLGGVVG